MARALLPTGLLAPAVFGWIALWGLRASPEAAGPDLIVTLCVMATILVFFGLITRIPMQMHRTHVERARGGAHTLG